MHLTWPGLASSSQTGEVSKKMDLVAADNGIRRGKQQLNAQTPALFNCGGGRISRADPGCIIEHALLNYLSHRAWKFSQPSLYNVLFQRRKPVWIWTSPEPCLADLQTAVPMRHLKLYNYIFKHLWDLNCVPLKWKKKKRKRGKGKKKKSLRLPARVISPKCFIKDLIAFWF